MAAYGRLKQSGLLKEAGNDLLEAVSSVRANKVADNIAAWKAYRDAGMPEELIMALMLAPGVDYREVVKKAIVRAAQDCAERENAKKRE